jgi:hypothetical protein
MFGQDLLPVQVGTASCVRLGGYILQCVHGDPAVCACALLHLPGITCVNDA